MIDSAVSRGTENVNSLIYFILVRCSGIHQVTYLLPILLTLCTPLNLAANTNL